MKKIVLLMMLVAGVVCSGAAFAQKVDKKAQKEAEAKAKAAELTALMESKHYMLVVDRKTQPEVEEITDYCGLWISPKQFKLYMPWKSGNFETSDFQYEASQTKKGGWNVTIKVRDQWTNTDYTFKLAVLPNAKTTLDVLDNKQNRSVYTGMVKTYVPR